MKGDYPYVINPICEGIPMITKELLDEIAYNLEEMIDVDFDYVLAPEAMGIHIAAAYTMRTGKPFKIIRKRGHGLPGEICIEKSTGYESTVRTYINSVRPGDRAVIVDDIISTGGTMRPIIRALRDAGVEVVMIAVVLNKSADPRSPERDLGVPVRHMLSVSVEDGKPIIR